MMTNQMTILTGKGKNMLVPNSQAIEEKILKKSTQTKLNQNNHSHTHLPPFGIIEKG